jgi:hypothetical protein
MNGDDPLHDPRFPNRPQHPDFWRLADAVLENDAAVEDGTGIEEFLAPYVDLPSLAYMAEQRAALYLSRAGLPVDLAPFVAAGWVDGWIAGVKYQEKGGHRSE